MPRPPKPPGKPPNDPIQHLRTKPKRKPKYTNYTDEDIAFTPSTTIKSVRPIHKLIAMARASGKTPAQIAADTGYSVAWIQTVIYSPLVKALVRQYVDTPDPIDLAKAAKDIVKRYAPIMAMSVVEMAMDPSVDPAVRLRAADSALDRAGVSRVTQTDVVMHDLPEEDMTVIEGEVLRVMHAKPLPRVIADAKAREADA